MQGLRYDPIVGGGGRRPFEVDSFHAAPIGIMLKVYHIGGTRPPVPPGGGALDSVGAELKDGK